MVDWVSVCLFLVPNPCGVNWRSASALCFDAQAMETPLHLAVAAGKSSVVSLLLHHGAEVSAKTGDRESLLRARSREIMDLLFFFFACVFTGTLPSIAI